LIIGGILSELNNVGEELTLVDANNVEVLPHVTKL
jgi:hypothetical protein